MKLFVTDQWALLFLRIGCGLGMAYHGYQKVFGDNMDMMIEGVAKMGFPLPFVFAWAAALSEFAGGLAIALGFKTRCAAFLVFVTMSVAAFMVHGQDPFNVKELALAYWFMSAALMGLGAGSLSVDKLIGSRR